MNGSDDLIFRRKSRMPHIIIVKDESKAIVRAWCSKCTKWIEAAQSVEGRRLLNEFMRRHRHGYKHTK